MLVILNAAHPNTVKGSEVSVLRSQAFPLPNEIALGTVLNFRTFTDFQLIAFVNFWNP